MNISKEAGHNYPETISGDSPCSMFTAGTRTEILSRHKDLSTVSRIIQYKILVKRTIWIVTPVTEQIITKEFLFTSCRL